MDGNSFTVAGRLLPLGFGAYARVLPPFEGPRGFAVHVGQLVTDWGYRLVPEGRYADGLLAGMDEASLAERNLDLPAPGELPIDVGKTLSVILGYHTTSPRQCYFAVWGGFGGLQPRHGWGAQFYLPGREMHLYTAPIQAAGERFDGAAGPNSFSPSLWWPADHAWCVATDTDLRPTYIACAEAARDDLLQSGLDVLPAAPDDPPLN